MGTELLRVCGALLGLWLASLSYAAVSLPFEQNLAGRPLFDPNQGFGFESSNGQRFSIQLPEGNYRVTVRFGGARGHPAMTLYAEQRRLMASRAANSRPGEITFVVNVRTPDLPALPENATGGSRVALTAREIGSATWDDGLTLEFSPEPYGLEALKVERVEVPTLYLAGDSTVSDQPAPNGSWGQYLPACFPGIAVANHAESGETLKSFVTELRLAKLLSTLRAGDWVMIQFGHNDQKAQWPQTYADAATTYRTWLRTYIAEIRARGATPLLVTSPERRNFDTDGRIRPTLAEYAQAMRAVAREEKVALIDLNAASVRFYESLGPGVSPRAFADNGDDKTHHSEYGARQLAGALIQGLRNANPALTAGLEKHIAAVVAPFNPSDPPLPDK